MVGMVDCLKEFRVSEDTTSAGRQFQSNILLGERRMWKAECVHLLSSLSRLNLRLRLHTEWPILRQSNSLFWIKKKVKPSLWRFLLVSITTLLNVCTFRTNLSKKNKKFKKNKKITSTEATRSREQKIGSTSQFHNHAQYGTSGLFGGRHVLKIWRIIRMRGDIA